MILAEKKPDYHAKTNEIKSEIPNIAGLATTVALSAIYFLCGFSFTDTDNSQDNRGSEGTMIYSSLPLPPTHKHSEIYLHFCM